MAELEEKRFFSHNPHLNRPYRNRLLAVALCQGAALQYLGRGRGVNDFDVHFFYRQNPNKPRLSRAVKRIRATVGSFHNVPVDFIRTVIPLKLCSPRQRDDVVLLQEFLRKAPTANARYLAEKGVIGLSPAKLFGKTIWK
ncbi:MAG: hypothetical protein ACLQDC_04540 [Verrucomicrobiia bacterium]